MPIYEYTCEACEHDFEELIRSTGKTPDLRCPGCGARRVKRRPSTFSARAANGPTPQEMPNCGRPQCAGGRCQGLS